MIGPEFSNYQGGEWCETESDCPYSATGSRANFLGSRNRDAGLVQSCIPNPNPRNASQPTTTPKVCSNFDADNHAIRTSLPAFVSTQTCDSSSGNGFLWATQSYDAYGRPLQTTTPLDPSGNQPATLKLLLRHAPPFWPAWARSRAYHSSFAPELGAW